MMVLYAGHLEEQGSSLEQAAEEAGKADHAENAKAHSVMEKSSRGGNRGFAASAMN